MQRTTNDQSFLPPLWILTTLLLALLLWLLFALKEIVVLLVVGYAVAYVIDPMLEWLERREISRSVGFFIILLVTTLGLLVLATTALPTIIDEAQKLVDRSPAYYATAKARIFAGYRTLLERAPLEWRGRLDISPEELLPALGPGALRGVLAGTVTALLSGYSITLTLMNLALLPFIVYYLAVDFPALHSTVLSFVPRSYRAAVIDIGHDIDRHVSAFVRGQLLVGCVLAVLYMLGLGAVGIELWFVIAVISGFGNLVPYLGSVLGIVSSSIMALVTFADFTHLLWVWAVFAIVQFLEGTFITPRIVGDRVGLSPLTVILAVLAAGKIFGLLGLFLAVPIAAALRVMANRLHRWFVDQVESDAHVGPDRGEGIILEP